MLKIKLIFFFIITKIPWNQNFILLFHSSKGSLTGGYFNKSRSRLEIQKTRSEKTEEIAQQDDDMKELRGKLNDIESDINRVVSEMQKTETKNSKAKDVFEKVKTDVRLYKEELNNIGKNHALEW